jgi:pyridoxine 5-phosphate synthase
MLAIALRNKPHAACIVPEKRTEVTTEGGLDVAGQQSTLERYVAELQAHNIRVSLFIDPDKHQLEAAKALGAAVIELHTGKYCETTGAAQAFELERLRDAALYAEQLGLECHAGHGLNYATVGAVAAIPTLKELNIGHFLIGEAIFLGLEASITEMKRLMQAARQ